MRHQAHQQQQQQQHTSTNHPHHIQMRRVKPASEYQNLRHVVPSLRRQRDVDKVEVVTEAARYIDQLHRTLIERFVLCGIPDSLKDILGTDNANELGSRHIMNLVASMAQATQREQKTASTQQQQRRLRQHEHPHLQLAQRHQKQQKQRHRRARHMAKKTTTTIRRRIQRQVRVLPPQARPSSAPAQSLDIETSLDKSQTGRQFK